MVISHSYVSLPIGRDQERERENLSTPSQAGQFFAPHGDFSSNGTRSSAGFVDCARLATLFVYLNDVERGPGPQGLRV